MTSLFLEEIERHHDPGPRGEVIRELQAEGMPVPGIMHLFAFRPGRNSHLERFTQGVMRGPSELSPGQRELIAAFTSERNSCPF